MIKEICSLLNLHFKDSLLKDLYTTSWYQRGKFRFSVSSTVYTFAKQVKQYIVQQFEYNGSCYCMILTRGSYPSLLSFAFAPNSKCTVISFLQKFRQNCIYSYNSNTHTQTAIKLQSLCEILCQFQNIIFQLLIALGNQVNMCTIMYSQERKN